MQLQMSFKSHLPNVPVVAIWNVQPIHKCADSRFTSVPMLVWLTECNYTAAAFYL